MNKDANIRLQDNVVLEHYGLNELHLESVRHYREQFAKVKPNHPWNGLETKDFLYKIGAWGKIRDTNKEGLTLAGLLMFSEERMITEVLPQYFLEYREYGDDELHWSNRFTSQDGTWSGNIYDFYFKVMHEVNDVSQVEKDAVHEALMNAIVHADYSGDGGIIVERQRSCIQMSNPGLFGIPLEQANSGGVSYLRNPNMFKMFIYIQFCKRAGVGLKTMETIYSQQFAVEQYDFQKRTVVTLPIVSFPERHDYINEIEALSDWMGDAPLSDSINKENNSYNNDQNSVNNEFESVNKDPNSLNIEINPVNKVLDSINKKDSSVNKDDNSVNISFNSVNKLGEEEERNIDQELWSIAEIARKKKRLAPAKMEEVILQLCAHRPLMLKELAYLLDRTPDGLRNNYLGKLLAEGKMRLKYPDQLNHPKQAYITNKQYS
ncbi:transcriptional regulator [Anoxybacillus kestanbolensis]|uniref:transcriptional regulator n=1 Tax=Anoxybacillus kestanbolensis TaxID=227476 RepID=UPI003D244787